MTNKARIDPNILFKKIKNQFLAAVIGISVTIAVLIPTILIYKPETTQLVIIIVAYLIIIGFAIYSIINLNKFSPDFLQLKKSEFDSRLVAQNLSQIILSFGEVCLGVDITDNFRAFAADALATSVKTFREKVSPADKQLIELLDEIKNVSESEKHLKEAFTEVLKKSH
jgi:hypothetical protein